MYAGQWIETLGMSEARYRETVLLPRAERRARLEDRQADARPAPVDGLRWPHSVRWLEVWLRCG